MDWDTDVESDVDHFGAWSDAQTCVVGATDDEPNDESDDSKSDDSDSREGQSDTTGGGPSSGTSAGGSASPKNQRLPRTGDETRTGLSLLVAGLGLTAGGLVVRRARQRA